MLTLRLFIHRLRTTLPATAFPDILRAGHRRSGMPDERHIGGNINESGDPFERARANISCGGIWCGLVGYARQRAEAGRQHHRRSRTRYPRVRSAEGRRLRHGGTDCVVRDLRYAHLSRRQRQAAAEARTVLGALRGLQDVDLQAASWRQVPRRHAVQRRGLQGQFRPAEGSCEQVSLRLLYLLHQRRSGTRRADVGL